MQRYVFEEHLDILCSVDEIELEELMGSAQDEFIVTMFRIHQATSRKKWK